MTAGNYVGRVKFKAVLSDISSHSAGGMAAVSAGIIAIWFNSGQPAQGTLLLALVLNALAIPLLVGSIYFEMLIRQHEHVSRKAHALIENIHTVGLSLATTAYLTTLGAISKVVLGGFLIGIVVAGTALYLIAIELGKSKQESRGI